MLLYEEPWLNQPQGDAELGGDLPAGTIAYIGGQNRLLGGPAYSAVGVITRAATVGGLAVSGTTSSYINAGKVAFAQAGSISWLMQFVIRDSAIRYVSGTLNTGTSYIERIAVNSDSNTATPAAGKLAIQLRRVGTAERSCNTAVACLTVGKVHTAIIQLTDSNTIATWVDGVRQPVTYASTGAVGLDNGTSEFDYDLINQNVRGAHTSGSNVDLLLFARIPRLLPSPENLTQHQSAPWKLFAPLPRRIWAPGVAGAPFKPAWAIGSNAVIGAGVMV